MVCDKDIECCKGQIAVTLLYLASPIKILERPALCREINKLTNVS
jgi:hypothetical protein